MVEVWGHLQSLVTQVMLLKFGPSLVSLSAASSACAKALQWQRAFALHLGWTCAALALEPFRVDVAVSQNLKGPV